MFGAYSPAASALPRIEEASCGGTSSRRSTSSSYGYSSFSTKSRTVSTISRCSGESSKSIPLTGPGSP